MKTFTDFLGYLYEETTDFVKDMKYFKKEVDKNEFTEGDFGKFQITDFGFTYVFDGYVDCAVVYENGVLYDLQDTDHKKLKTPEGRKAEIKRLNSKFKNIKDLTKSIIGNLNPNNM